MPRIQFDDTPLPPGTVMFENAVPKEVQGSVSNAGPDPQPNVDEPFLNYTRLPKTNAERVVDERVTAHQKYIADLSSMINNETGAAFDPTGELQDKALRFDMGRSDKLSERKAKFENKFKDAYPNLQYKRVTLADGRGIDVFRFNREEPFRPVENLNTTTYSDVAQHTGSIVNEETAGALLAAAVTRDLPLLGRMAATGIGTYAGGRLQSGIEGVRGYEHTPYSELQGKLLTDAGLAAATELVNPGSGAAATIRDAVAKPMPSAGKVVKFAEDENLAPLVVGQVAQNPTTRAAFQQAGGTSSRVEEVVTKQRTSVHNALQKRVNDYGFDALSDPQLQKLADEQLKELDSILRNPKMSKSEAGQDLQNALNTWEDNSRATRDRLYAKAKDIGDNVEFDLKPLKAASDEIRVGTLGRPAAEGADPVQLKPVGQRLAPILDRIDRLHEVMGPFQHGGREFNPIQQMVDLRDELYGIMRFSPDANERRQAATLWGATKDAMEDPMGGDRRFLYNYNKAKDFHSQREDLLDKAYIKQGLEKSEPGQLPNMIFKPGNEQTITQMKELAGPDAWQKIKDYKKSELLSDPASIGKMFDDFANDKKALDAFFSKDEQSLLSAFHGRWKMTQMPTVQKMLGDQKSLGERAVELATQGKAGELQSIIDVAEKAGVDIKTSLKAGVYQHLLDNAATTEFQAGGRLIDPAKLKTQIEVLRKKPGISQFMDDADWQRLENYQLYVDAISENMDTGGQMQKGAIVSKAKSFLAPHKMMSAFFSMRENNLVARILADPVTYEKFSAALGATTDTQAVSRLANTLALVAKRAPQGALPAGVVGIKTDLETDQ